VFIVGHLRGTPRPQVFPFGENGGTPNELPRHYTNTLTARYEGAQATGSYIGEGKLDAQEIQQLNQPKHSNDRVYGTGGVAPTLNTMQGGNRQPFVKVPEATKKGYAEATVGQSINLSVMGSATRRGRVSDVAQTLDTGMQQHTLTSDMKIRRLTPIECERLQGFPDGWTKYGGHKKAADIISKNPEHGNAFEIISDTQRYKTLGNAVTVNVVVAVMKEVLK
jgi:DNA (cytosine-5)-methyltransferase 1